MKIRTVGTTYTESTKRLARGVLENDPEAQEPRIVPELLVEKFARDPDWVLREVISVLDKTIRKRRFLRDFDLQAYSLRVRLAEALWSDCIVSLAKPKQLGVLEERWKQRTHPYAEKEVDPENPETDGNSTIISKAATTGNLSTEFLAEEFRGRWFDAFFTVHSKSQDNIKAVSATIKDHLFFKEITSQGNPRLTVDETGARVETNVGLIARRLKNLTESTHDPRKKTTRRKHSQGQDEGALELYFEVDVAAEIYNAVKDLNSFQFEPNGAFFGSRLHTHFHDIEVRTAADKRELSEAELKELWGVHNAVRQHYAKLGRSKKMQILRRSVEAAVRAEKTAIERLAELSKAEFQRGETQEDRNSAKAVSEITLKECREKINSAKAALLQKLPRDRTAFASANSKKIENRDLSGLIRLGKLIVHASDIDLSQLDGQDNAALNEKFAARIDQLTTSDGQAEIKRNESFTRVFRDAVSLSHRTLTVLATPDPINPPLERLPNSSKPKKDQLGRSNTDIAQNVVQQDARRMFEQDHFENHVALIFGAKPNAEGQSRAELFHKSGVSGQTAMLDIMSRLRNQTNHFSTLPRLAELMTGNLLTQDSRDARRAINTLLQYDIDLKKQVLIDDLNSLNAAHYCGENLETLKEQIGLNDTATDVPAPRFMAVLRQLDGLRQFELCELTGVPLLLAELNIEPGETTKRNANGFKVGILRMLYSTGFKAWLTTDESKARLSGMLEHAIDQKKKRTEMYRQSEGWIHRYADDLTQTLGLNPKWDLQELFKHIYALAATEEQTNRSYGVQKSKQKDVANRLERFRQELYGYMFAAFLVDSGLDFIFSAEDTEDDTPSEDRPKVTEIEVGSLLPKEERWHTELYTWLYTVPPTNIARLRHQMRKTRALELKAEKKREDYLSTLDAIDALMGLYTSVQAAGFDGTEHDFLPTPTGAPSNWMNSTCFEADVAFDVLVGTEDNEDTYAGVRRGLRQMVRFGNHSVLSRLFEKHRVTRQEVEELKLARTSEEPSFQEGSNKARKNVMEAWKDYQKLKKENRPKKENLEKRLLAVQSGATVCKEETANARKRDMFARAARLGEHARTHDVFMSIIGRLVDYAAMWERDMYFLWFGLLYRQCEESMKRTGQTGSPIKLKLADDTICIETGQGHSVPVWNAKGGFSSFKFFQDDTADVLKGQNKTLFERIAKNRTRNQKDDLANQELKRGGLKARPLSKSDPFLIRNDLAHYNIIADLRKKPKWSLTYTVNAVRSLFSYDRKMKNAISGSIKRILEREGFEIAWDMHQDRLRFVTVECRVETHLSMIPDLEGQHIRFEIPRHSPRLVSMVQGLFDHDDGGHRKKVGGKRIGIIKYQGKVIAPGTRTPAELRDMTYPALANP